MGIGAANSWIYSTGIYRNRKNYNNNFFGGAMVSIGTVSDIQIKETIFKLLERIAPEADFNTLAPGEDLRTALDIDSFDFLNFLIGLNQELGVEIPEADYSQVVTLAGLMNYISARLQ
jgi:acyl carrier protein